MRRFRFLPGNVSVIICNMISMRGNGKNLPQAVMCPVTAIQISVFDFNSSKCCICLISQSQTSS